MKQETLDRIRRFTTDRDWDQFHSPENLAKSIVIEAAELLCKIRGIDNIRVDTHRDNAPMRRVIEENRFTCCGIIYLADGSPRLAFEWIEGD